ncbi:MAG: Xaa-Pro peptidase family protein [Pseudomonadota bacterium]
MDEKTVYHGRLKKLREKMLSEDMDAIWVLKEENRRYLSGFTGHDGQCDESAGSLFISYDRQILATDARYIDHARQEVPHFELECQKKGLLDLLPEIVQGLGIKRLGFESGRCSYLQIKNAQESLKKAGSLVELVPCSDMVERLRVIKEPVELDLIIRSLAIAEQAFQKIIQSLMPGMLENEVAWHLEKELRENGAEAMAFSPIVAAGENSALPHAIPSRKRIDAGVPILFDFGARYSGYCSDISRTLILGDPADSIFDEVCRVVSDAQQKAIDSIRPGASSLAVDAAARNHIEKSRFRGLFNHGLGHGVGLAVHEKPSINSIYDVILEPGMVVTVEPGVYMPGWGGVRLENMVVVTEDGAEVLNRIPVQPDLGAKVFLHSSCRIRSEGA